MRVKKGQAQMDLERAMEALNEYDERKCREAAAFLSGMPAVDLYVERHADVWEQRRGSSALDQRR